MPPHGPPRRADWPHGALLLAAPPCVARAACLRRPPSHHASMERQPGEEPEMVWVPADKGDGIRREVDYDKRGPHDNGTAREEMG